MNNEEMKRCKWMLNTELNIDGFFNKLKTIKYWDERLLKTLPEYEKKLYVKCMNNCSKYDFNAKINVIVSIKGMVIEKINKEIEKKQRMLEQYKRSFDIKDEVVNKKEVDNKESIKVINKENDCRISIIWKITF